MKRVCNSVLAVILLASYADAQLRSPEQTGSFIAVFGGSPLVPTRRDRNVSYDLDPLRERFFVHVPADYTRGTSYGLVVFIDAGEVVDQLPEGWLAQLDRRHLFFVAPERGGNDQYSNRRLGLAVLGALEMMKVYRIDPKRVYAAGFSGGARIAGLLGFFQPDLFGGTIQNSGADFYRRVPTVYASSWLSTTGQPYGTFSASPEEIARAKRVRFVFITGSNDFRRGNILDIFNGGFIRDGFKAKLFDVPGMGHTTCDGDVLSSALDFVDGSP